MKIFKFIKFFFLVFLISACAGPATQRISIDNEALDAETKLQQKLSLEKVKARYERLQKVGYPILKNILILKKRFMRLMRASSLLSLFQAQLPLRVV